MEQKILEAYADGKPLEIIANNFNITIEQLQQILITYKEKNRYKKSFTDDFKRLIADRDQSGISRRKIAKELGINASIVKKACEQFGQSIKNKATSENVYIRIDGNFNMDICPSCNSRKVNEVDDNTIYCMDCGDEYIFKKGYILKVMWEYIE